MSKSIENCLKKLIITREDGLLAGYIDIETKDAVVALEQLINKALTKEVGHWITEYNLDHELFEVRIAKRFLQLKKAKERR